MIFHETKNFVERSSFRYLYMKEIPFSTVLNEKSQDSKHFQHPWQVQQYCRVFLKHSEFRLQIQTAFKYWGTTSGKF